MLVQFAQWIGLTLFRLDSIAAAIQAVSALAVAVLTYFLVSFTRRYVKRTEEALRLSADQLQLAREQLEEQRRFLQLSREQYEREWQPDLRIANIQRVGGEQVLLSVANFARPAALVKKLLLGTGGRAEQGTAPQGVESFSVRFLVSGGQIREDIAIQLYVGEYRRKYSPPQAPVGQRSQWQAGFSAALVYYCGGKDNQTPWRDFSATLHDYIVVNLVCPDEPSQ